MTTTPTKSRRASVILECVRIAAEHFHITRDEILHGRHKARSPEQQARRLIWWHLNRHGVTDAEIARVWDRTETVVKAEIRYAFLHLIDPYAMLLRTLPAIPEHPPKKTPTHV